MWKILLHDLPETCANPPSHPPQRMSVPLPALSPHSYQLWVFLALPLKPSLSLSIHWKIAHCFKIFISYIYKWGLASLSDFVFSVTCLFISFTYFYFGLLPSSYWSSNFNSLHINKISFLLIMCWKYFPNLSLGFKSCLLILLFLWRHLNIFHTVIVISLKRGL